MVLLSNANKAVYSGNDKQKEIIAEGFPLFYIPSTEWDSMVFVHQRVEKTIFSTCFLKRMLQTYSCDKNK